MKTKIVSVIIILYLVLGSIVPVFANGTEGDRVTVNGTSANASLSSQMGQGIRIYIVDPATGAVVSSILDLPSASSLTGGTPIDYSSMAQYQGTKMGNSPFPTYYRNGGLGSYEVVMGSIGYSTPPTTYASATYIPHGDAIKEAMKTTDIYKYIDSSGNVRTIKDPTSASGYLELERITGIIDLDVYSEFLLYLDGVDYARGITPSMIIAENGYNIHIETLLWAKINCSEAVDWGLSWVYGTVTEVGAYCVSQGKTSNYLAAGTCLSVHSHALTLQRNEPYPTMTIRSTTQPKFISLNTMSQVDQGHALHVWGLDWEIPTSLVSSTYIDKEYRNDPKIGATNTSVSDGEAVTEPDIAPHTGLENNNVPLFEDEITSGDARYTVTKIYLSSLEDPYITDVQYDTVKDEFGMLRDYADVSHLKLDYITSRTEMTQNILIEEEYATEYQLAYWYATKTPILFFHDTAGDSRYNTPEYKILPADNISKNLLNSDLSSPLLSSNIQQSQIYDWGINRTGYYKVDDTLSKEEIELQTLQIMLAVDSSLQHMIGFEYTAYSHLPSYSYDFGTDQGIYFEDIDTSFRGYSRSVSGANNYGAINQLKEVLQKNTVTKHANIKAEEEFRMIANPVGNTNWQEKELVLILIKDDVIEPDWTSTYIDEEYREGQPDAKTTNGEQVPVPDVPPDPRVDSPNYDLTSTPPDTWTNDIIKVYRKEIGTDHLGNKMYTHETTEWRADVPNYIKVENEYGTPYGVVQWYTTDESIEEIEATLTGGLTSDTEYGDLFDITFNSKSNITSDIVEVGHSAPTIADIVMDSDKNYYSGTSPESENVGIPSSTVYSDTFTDVTGKETLVVLLEIDNSYSTSTLKDDPKDTPPSTPSTTPDGPPGLGEPDHPWHPYNPFDPTDPTLVYNITKTYREKDLNTGDITHIETFKLDKQPPTIEIEDEIVETGYGLIEWYLSSCTDTDFGTIASGNTWEELTAAYDSLLDGTGETTIKVSNTVDATTLHLLYEKGDMTIPLEGDNKIIITESALTKAVETTDENDVIVADPTDLTAETNWGKVTLPWSFTAHDEATDAVLADIIKNDPYDIAYQKLNFKYLYDMTTAEKTPSENLLASKLSGSGAFDLVYSNFYNTSFKVNAPSENLPSTFKETYYNNDNRYGVNLTLWRGEDRPTLASYKETGSEDNIKALLGTASDKLPDTGFTRADDGSEEFELPLQVTISTDSDLMAEGLTSDRYMTPEEPAIPGTPDPSGTLIGGSDYVAPKHIPLYLEFAIEDDELPDYKAIVEVQTFKGVDHAPGTEIPTSIGGTFNVIDTVKVKYYPFITMSYQETNSATTFTTTSAKNNNPDKSEVKIISTHESEVDLHSAFMVSWGRTSPLTEPNLLLTSSQWSIHSMATNESAVWKQKDNVLPGGALFNLSVDMDAPMTYVDIVTYLPYVDEDIQNDVLTEVTGTLATSVADLAPDLLAHDEFVTKAEEILEYWHIVQVVNSNNAIADMDNKKALEPLDYILSGTKINVDAKHGITSSSLTGATLSTDSKYHLKNIYATGTTDSTTDAGQGDLDILAKIETQTHYWIGSNSRTGEVILAYNLTGPVETTLDSTTNEIKVTITGGNVVTVIPKSRHVENSNNVTSTMTEIEGIIATLPEVYKTLDSSTKIITNFLLATTLNTGEDNTAAWALSDGNWYNEGFEGFRYLENKTRLILGFKNPTRRTGITDPALNPVSKGQSDMFTNAYSSQFVTADKSSLASIASGNAGYIGTFGSDEYILADAQTMFMSKIFAIPNVNVQDLS